jgi:multidrug efflux pump subunit AcrB
MVLSHDQGGRVRVRVWIVRLALRRPSTFVVAFLIVVLGVVTFQRILTDIFPEVRIPIAASSGR